MEAALSRIAPHKGDRTVTPKVAVLIPCYNEEVAIPKVISDFRASLPDAEIYVYDNNSSDRTVEVARAAGVIVRGVSRQGKGNVVRQMFADIEADAYVLVDGDDTYDAFSAPDMVQMLVTDKLDMVVGVRVTDEQEAYRSGHRMGNAMLTGFVTLLFGRSFSDMLSGYRVFSRRYVKSFPAMSEGFDTETEITVHALGLRMPTAEVRTAYRSRPEGSESKLHTYRDGFRILKAILTLFRSERPLSFFSIVAAIFAIIGIVLIIPVLITYLDTGLVPRLPTAILSMGLMVVAFLSFTSGVVLETVTRGRQEIKRLFYLSVPHGAREPQQEGDHNW
ncbi:MAG: glycosyltransferase family 2 protein [Firmicutes bacterium]|nr:glycosyltransferase family 2 protein [Bacillota bacterium]